MTIYRVDINFYPPCPDFLPLYLACIMWSPWSEKPVLFLQVHQTGRAQVLPAPSDDSKRSQYNQHNIYGYGSKPISINFNGMNIHKSQLF